MLLAAAARLPLPLLHGLANLFAPLLCHVLRYRRSVVDANLRAAFPDATVAELHRHRDGFYRHLCQVAAEVVRASRMPAAQFGERVTLQPCAALESARESGPVIILTLHKANAEWGLHALAQTAAGVIDPVYKRVHNTSLDTFLHQLRSRFGACPVPVGDAASLRSALRRGHGLCLLADQSPLPAQATGPFQFLGRQTWFQGGIVALAQLSGYPVFFADIQRVRTGFYQVSFEALLEAGADPLAQDLLGRYVKACERAVLAQPESWLWSHRRWRRHSTS